MNLLEKSKCLILSSMLIAIGAMSVFDNSAAEDRASTPVNVTVLNIHVKELSSSSNFGPGVYLCYMIWVDDSPVYTRPPLYYPAGVVNLDDFYNVTISNNSAQLEIGGWWMNNNVMVPLDLSSYFGEAEPSFSKSDFKAFPTFRPNTFVASYNVSSQTLSGDSTSMIGNYYYTNGSTDGTGNYNGGMTFALTTFNQTIPLTDVNVYLNATIANNVTLNATPPQINISVPVPSVLVEVNVSPPNVSAPTVNISQPVIINQSPDNISVPAPIVNISYSPPPLNLNVSPPDVNITFSPNDTGKTPIVKTSLSTGVQIPSMIYMTLALLSIGTIIAGCIAIGMFANMKRMLALMEASRKTPDENGPGTK